jgi:hypothetical protein
MTLLSLRARPRGRNRDRRPGVCPDGLDTLISDIADANLTQFLRVSFR